MNCYIIGVAGGSGSGKTFFTHALQKHLGADVCQIIYQDNYYIDQSHRFDGDGGSVNFDHPSSLEFSLLARDLVALKLGQNVQVPIYDFVTHTRQKKTIPLHPTKIILVDGILILNSKEVRAVLDEAVFFDTPEGLRYSRRLHRDVNERGRTPEGVKKQFDLQVRPMHDQFVEPSKRFAHTVICDLGEYTEVLQAFCSRLGSL